MSLVLWVLGGISTLIYLKLFFLKKLIYSTCFFKKKKHSFLKLGVSFISSRNFHRRQHIKKLNFVNYRWCWAKLHGHWSVSRSSWDEQQDMVLSNWFQSSRASSGARFCWYSTFFFLNSPCFFLFFLFLNCGDISVWLLSILKSLYVRWYFEACLWKIFFSWNFF